MAVPERARSLARWRGTLGLAQLLKVATACNGVILERERNLKAQDIASAELSANPTPPLLGICVQPCHATAHLGVPLVMASLTRVLPLDRTPVPQPLCEKHDHACVHARMPYYSVFVGRWCYTCYGNVRSYSRFTLQK